MFRVKIHQALTPKKNRRMNKEFIPKHILLRQKWLKDNLIRCHEILYKVGILFKDIDSSKSRKFLYNPFLIMTVNAILFFKEVSSLLFNRREYSIVMGDIAMDWKQKSQWNLWTIAVLVFSEGSHLLHFYFNYYNRKNEYLLSFTREDLMNHKHPDDIISKTAFKLLQALTRVSFLDF